MFLILIRLKNTFAELRLPPDKMDQSKTIQMRIFSLANGFRPIRFERVATMTCLCLFLVVFLLFLPYISLILYRRKMSDRAVSERKEEFCRFQMRFFVVFERTRFQTITTPFTVKSITIAETIVSCSLFFEHDDEHSDGIFSSRSPPNHRPKRTSPPGRRAPNEVHRENPIPSPVLGVFGLSQHTVERDLKGKQFLFVFD